MKQDLIFSRIAGGLDLFPHLEMLGYRTVKKLGAGTLPQHRNPGIEICHIHKGRFDWTVEGRSAQVLPGSASVTFPWQVHGGTREAMDIGSLSWIILRPQIMTPSGKFKLGTWSSLQVAEQAYIMRQLQTAPQPILLPGHVASRNCFREIFSEFSAQKQGWVWRVNRLMDDLLLSLARSIEYSAAERKRTVFDVGVIDKAVRGNPARSWKQDDLCALSGWSKSALNLHMKSVTGCSTMEYVMTLRLKLAQEWLQQTERSVTDIAFELGFSSSQHFSMAFRQRTGMPPSEFRRR